MRRTAPLAALAAALGALLVYARSVVPDRAQAAAVELEPRSIERAVADDAPLAAAPRDASSARSGERDEDSAPPAAIAAAELATLVVHVRGVRADAAPAGAVVHLWRGGLPGDALRVPDRELALETRASAELAELARARHGLRVSAPGCVAFELELDLADGSRAMRHVAAVLAPLGEPIVGRVLDARGAPVAGALVCLDAKDPSAPALRFERATVRGDARLSGLPPRARTDASGRFVLAAPAGEGARELVVCPDANGEIPLHRAALSVDADSELVVELPDTVPVELRCDERAVVVRRGALVLDPALDPLVSQLPNAAELRGIEREGDLLRLRLPIGRYELELRGDGSPERRALDVQQGSLFLDLRGSG